MNEKDTAWTYCMKCLVTGASGFIGTHLVKALKARGDEVIKVPRELLSAGDGSYGEFCEKHNPDYIFHLAAYGNMANQKDQGMTVFTNIFGTFTTLFAIANVPYKAFINVSSSSVTLPHETMYSATKAGAERLCKAFADEYNKPIVTVRPYSVYGPGESSFRFIPTAFRSCLDGEPMTLDPDPVHDWVYVDDVVEYMIALADDAVVRKGGIYEAGTGVSISNGTIVSLIEKLTGKKANVKITKKPLRSFDNKSWAAGYSLPKFDSINLGLQKYYESIK